MGRYCVNKDMDIRGFHEVHNSECCFPSFLPKKDKMICFEAESDSKAMEAAKKFYKKVDGCYYCMQDYNFRW